MALNAVHIVLQSNRNIRPNQRICKPWSNSEACCSLPTNKTLGHVNYPSFHRDSGSSRINKIPSYLLTVKFIVIMFVKSLKIKFIPNRNTCLVYLSKIIFFNEFVWRSFPLPKHISLLKISPQSVSKYSALLFIHIIN